MFVSLLMIILEQQGNIQGGLGVISTASVLQVLEI